VIRASNKDWTPFIRAQPERYVRELAFIRKQPYTLKSTYKIRHIDNNFSFIQDLKKTTFASYFDKKVRLLLHILIKFLREQLFLPHWILSGREIHSITKGIKGGSTFALSRSQQRDWIGWTQVSYWIGLGYQEHRIDILIRAWCDDLAKNMTMGSDTYWAIGNVWAAQQQRWLISYWLLKKNRSVPISDGDLYIQRDTRRR